DSKFYDIYAIENRGKTGPTALEDGLAQVGVKPADVAMVISSHLHFDHAGGNTMKRDDGSIVPSFPNARYVIQRGEYEWATHTNERTAASYFPHNFVGLRNAGMFELIEGEGEIIPGIRAIPTPGHTPGHHGLLIDGGAERAFYIADLVPTAAHLPLAWIMGYDVEPMVTLETKRHILKRAVDEAWLVVFEHDADTAWGTVVH